MRGGQIVIGWLDGLVGALPGDLDLYEALRRPAGAERAVGPRRSAWRRSPPGPCCPLAVACAARRGAAAAWRHRLRGGSSCLLSAPKVVVVMPARQAAATLERTVRRDPARRGRRGDPRRRLLDRRDRELGAAAAARTWSGTRIRSATAATRRPATCEALQRDADVVVMLHPDGQYEPELIPRMVEPIVARRGRPGPRLAAARSRAPRCAAGMPRWKFVANRFLTAIENRIMGTHLSEAHTGYRAYSRRLLLTVPFLRNSHDFVFDSELLMQAAHFGFAIEEVPARCRYFEDASSVGFKAGVVYGAKTLWAGVRLVLHRRGILRVAQVQP